ncbi:phage antirepressor, partial [Enterococcus faecalis]
DSLGRRQSFKVIPESDIYRLVIKSNLPNAEQFEEWVMEEVLPQIRKTGSYTNVPSSFAEALRLAADLEEEKMMLEQKVAEYEPKITYLDTILASKDT